MRSIPLRMWATACIYNHVLDAGGRATAVEENFQFRGCKILYITNVSDVDRASSTAVEEIKNPKVEEVVYRDWDKNQNQINI